MKTMVYKASTLQVLLANTLRERTDSYTLQQIMRQFPTLSELFHITEEELLQIDGIGPVKANQSNT